MNRVWNVGDIHECPLMEGEHQADFECVNHAKKRGDRYYAESGNVPDLINHPPHYTSSPAKCSGCGKPIECIDVTRHMMFAPGNATKYIWRRVFGGKAGEDNVEGLRKAIWYLQDEIARLERAA